MEPSNGTENEVQPAHTSRGLDRRNIPLETVKKYIEFLRTGRKPLKFFLKFDISPYLDDLYTGIENAKEVELEHYQQFLDDPDNTPGYALLALGLALIIESIVIHEEVGK